MSIRHEISSVSSYKWKNWWENNEAVNLCSHEICSMTGKKDSTTHLGGDLPCISLFLALSH
jgi:hypothetical protein